MEGKAAVLNTLGGVDGVDLELATEHVDRFVSIVIALEPSFGALNLEDIRAPDCFEIEERLQAVMAIPVLHDDQHGTAVVRAAALPKALDRTGRTPGSALTVIRRAGPAGVACARMLPAMGAGPDPPCHRIIHMILTRQP